MQLPSSRFFLFLLAIATLSFTACGNDDDDSGNDGNNIIEILESSPRFSTLLQALQQSGLDDDLASMDNQFTLFAPTNDAFLAAGINLNTVPADLLQETLLYHLVVGSTIFSQELPNGQIYLSSAANTGPNDVSFSILAEKNILDLKLNNFADVVTADIEASNGIVHAINGLLRPLDLLDMIEASANLSELDAAIVTAGLIPTLSGSGPFTLFAPINDAFTQNQTLIDQLSSARLSRLLLYHVISQQNLLSTDLILGNLVTANDETTITVNSLVPFEISDDENNIVAGIGFDVQTTNGVIHFLDGVLIPENL